MKPKKIIVVRRGNRQDQVLICLRHDGTIKTCQVPMYDPFSKLRGMVKFGYDVEFWNDKFYSFER